MGFCSETLRICEAGTVTTILSKHLTCIHHVYVHEHACTTEDQFIFVTYQKVSITLAETTQGRIDSPRKLAETTHLPRPKRPIPKIGRNDPGRNDSDRNDPGPKRPRFVQTVGLQGLKRRLTQLSDFYLSLKSASCGQLPDNKTLSAQIFISCTLFSLFTIPHPSTYSHNMRNRVFLMFLVLTFMLKYPISHSPSAILISNFRHQVMSEIKFNFYAQSV